MTEPAFLFQNPAVLWHLAWVVPGLVGVWGYAAFRRRGALHRFADPGHLPALRREVDGRRRWRKQGAVLTGAVLILVGLARPASDPEPAPHVTRGREVVFLLDVSRSMLAADVAPNRLERAKWMIRDCLAVLEGDRVALVAFAGATEVVCPLTMDYAFFEMRLDAITPDTVRLGGTKIGDAIRTVMRTVFRDGAGTHRDIILITDGEDHESAPVEAARLAGEAGIRILAIGLGDPERGARIPIPGTNRVVREDGRAVTTRMSPGQIRAIAAQTPGGASLPVGTRDVRLEEVYRSFARQADRAELQVQELLRYRERFSYVLLAAFVLLLLEPLVGERRRCMT